MSKMDPDNPVSFFAAGLGQRNYEEDIKAILGEERYKDYQLSHELSFRNLQKIVAREGLPPETVFEVARLDREFEAQKRAVATDGSRAPEDRKKAEADISQANEAALKARLGEKGYAAYMKVRMPSLKSINAVRVF
jgi:hypothetical protein